MCGMPRTIKFGNQDLEAPSKRDLTKKALGILAAVFVASAFSGHSAMGKIISQKISYQTSSTPMEGWAYYDDTAKPGSLPAVLVVHEWYGLNDYAKERAEMLAREGYVAFAVDMYGKGKVAEHPKDAKKFMEAAVSDPKELTERFKAAMGAVRKVKSSSGKISAVGYCFGGGVVLNMARAGLPLEGVVSFHGSLVSKLKAKPNTVKAKVLVATGGADPMVPAEQVGQFAKEMSEAGVNFSLHSYPEATHGFTSKRADALGKKYGLPVAYNANADKDSWAKTLKFLKQVL